MWHNYKQAARNVDWKMIRTRVSCDGVVTGNCGVPVNKVVLKKKI